MNIDKILNQEIKYNYLDRVEDALKANGLTFKDLKSYERCGRSKNGLKPDTIFKNKFGENVKPPDFKPTCLCGHRILEQCYLCPEGSNDINDVITLGNHCIKNGGLIPQCVVRLKTKLNVTCVAHLLIKKVFPDIRKHKNVRIMLLIKMIMIIILNLLNVLIMVV